MQAVFREVERANEDRLIQSIPKGKLVPLTVSLSFCPPDDFKERGRIDFYPALAKGLLLRLHDRNATAATGTL